MSTVPSEKETKRKNRSSYGIKNVASIHNYIHFEKFRLQSCDPLNKRFTLSVKKWSLL